MTYLGLLIGYLIIVLSPVIGLWHKAMPRLGQKPYAAFIPFYQYYVLLKACKLPWYWVVFLLFPGVQFVMFACLNVTFIRKFGQFGIKETILGILFPWPIFWKIANNEEQYPAIAPTNWDIAKQVNERKNSDHVALFFALPVLGHALAWPIFSALQFKKKPGKKTVLKECGDAILFAVIAASVIRTYVFEPFQIPTGSMEKTQMIGDHLFVDKLTYGPRVPMTPFSYPVFHNTIPYLNVKSYLEIQKIPYTRLPGWSNVERYDIIVFNYPAGDTAVYDPRMPNGLMGHNYYEILMDEALFYAKHDFKSLAYFEEHKAYYVNKARKEMAKGKVYSRANMSQEDYDRGYVKTYGTVDRPIDKKEHYIKRCVAIPGDEIEIVDKMLYVNGEMGYQSPTMQKTYSIVGRKYPARKQFYSGKGFIFEWTDADINFFRKEFDIYNPDEQVRSDEDNNVVVSATTAQVNDLMEKGVFLKPHISPKGKPKADLEMTYQNINYIDGYYHIFPNDPQYDWTEDNFGPLRIPAKGDVVELTHKSLPLYKRIITAYERHSLQEKADGIYVDGQKVTQYTIEQDYYWLMGDNRNNSADSRFWGFVPEDHVVGHAAFIFFSRSAEDGSVRWNRIFSGIE